MTKFIVFIDFRGCFCNNKAGRVQCYCLSLPGGLITGMPCTGPENETFCRVQCFCCYQGSMLVFIFSFVNVHLGFLRPCKPVAKIFCVKCDCSSDSKKVSTTTN